MKNRLIAHYGFALLEILVATLILAGVIYAFVNFSQGQGKQKAEENRGKYLAIIVNQTIKSTLPDGKCANPKVYELSYCINFSSQFRNLMKNNGFDLDNSTVQITKSSDPTDATGMFLITMTFPHGAYSNVQAALYAQQIMSNLTPESIRRFSANNPTSSLFTYAVGDQSKNTLQGDTIRLYITVKEDGS